MRARSPHGLVAASVVLLATSTARAGGFYLPDNGTQALGRGAAFVAKADDPTAIYHNPAGLARQRGTQLLFNGNLALHSFEFKRAGVFPDDPNNQETPWGGQPFPTVTNTGGPFFEPFLAGSTDFGSLDRLTIGAGIFGPPAVGNRTFPLGVKNAPAASRYDFVQSRSLLLFPTAAIAYRVTPWFDLGVSGHLIIGSFDQTTVSYLDIGQCKNVEYQPCDSRSRITASGSAVAATLGAMLRPADNYQFGLSIRTPSTMTAEGTLDPQPPASLQSAQVAPGAATLTNKLPLEARVGARYIDLDGDFELYDLELDLVYEGWGSAQATGPEVKVPALGTFKDIDVVSTHKYKNTYGIRAGGAYNLEALDGLLSLRAGAYYDSSSSDFAYTRLDFDTLTKIAGTFGIGYKRGAFQLDFAYAAVASLPRVVGTGQGDIRPANGGKQGRPVDNADQPLPAVNEGAYRGFTNILSFGVTVTFDQFFGPKRPIHYGNPYEPGYVGEGALPEKKPDGEDKDKDKKPEADDKDRKSDDDKRDEKKSDVDEKKKPSSDEKKKPDAAEEKKRPSSEEKKPSPPPEEKKPSKKPSSDEKKPEEKKPPAEEKKPEEKKPDPEKKEWWEELD